jgi:osmotically-inducible protein OsmY
MYPTVIQSNDELLRKRILNFLLIHGVDGLENIEVNVAGGIVTLFGKLKSSDDRVLCVECCRHVAGVLRIVDCVDSIKRENENTHSLF